MEPQYSVQFFNSLVESVHRLCENHLVFSQSVEVTGYLNVEMDNLKKERYVLSELLQSSGNVVSESFCVKAFNTGESHPASHTAWTKQHLHPRNRRHQVEEDYGGSGHKYRKVQEERQDIRTLQTQHQSYVSRNPTRNSSQSKVHLWDQDTEATRIEHHSLGNEHIQSQSTINSAQCIQDNVQTFESEASSVSKCSDLNGTQETMVTIPYSQPGDEISGDAGLIKIEVDVIDVDLSDDTLDPAPNLPTADVESFTQYRFHREPTGPPPSHPTMAGVQPSTKYKFHRDPTSQPKKKLSPGTIYTIRSAVNLFKKFHLNKSGNHIDLFSTSPERMNELLLEYFQGARKLNGGELSSRSLKNVQERLDIFLNDGGYPHSLRKDVEFATSNNYIQQILGESVKQPSPTYVHVDDEDIEMLFQYNQLGDHNPDTLINSMWFLNCKFFAIRRPNEHLEMKWRDIRLRIDDQGQEFVARPINDSLFLKKYANVENPDRCFVRLYKKFRDVRPSAQRGPECPFYLKHNKQFAVPGQCWFSSQPMSWSSFSNIWRRMVLGAFLPLNKKVF